MSNTGGNITVKLDAILRLLAESLYSRPDVCIRELLANAVDSLHARKDLEAARRRMNRDGRDEPTFEIKIWYEPTGALNVEDTGIGMTKEEILKYLTVIGESGTRVLKDSIRDHDIVKRLIGQFGIGLLSCFTLASKVEIRTSSCREEGENGYKWVCNPNGQYEIYDVEGLPKGTRVRLHIDEPAKRALVSEDALEKSVRLYGDFLPFPIYDKFRKKLNVQIPPWEDPTATDEDYSDYVTRRFGWDEPIFTIPIRSQPDLEMGGLIFIPSERDFLNRTGAVDLYVRHMLVRQDCPNVLPLDDFTFLAGVLECPELTMIISREDVMRNSVFDRFQKAITSQVVTRLGDLARNPGSLRAVMSAHGPQFKHSMLRSPGLFKEMIESLPFRSACTGKLCSLEQYLESANARLEDAEKRRIYFYTSAVGSVARFQINQVLASKGIDVLEAVQDIPGKSLDRRLLEQFAQENKFELCDAEERSDLFPEVSGWEVVERLFGSVVPSVARKVASVRTTEFEPEVLPLLIFNPKHGVLRDQLNDFMQSQVGQVPTTIMRLFKLAEARIQEEENTTLLLLNSKNEEMRLLREKVRSKVAPDVAIELYHLAMEYSGYVWDEVSLDRIRCHRQFLLKMCLQAADELDPYIKD